MVVGEQHLKVPAAPAPLTLPKTVEENPPKQNPDRFIRLVTSPKLMTTFKLLRNMITGGGILMNPEFGVGMGPLGWAIGAAVGAALFVLEKKGVLKPVGGLISRAASKAADLLHLNLKQRAQAKRVIMDLFDIVEDSTTPIEMASQLGKHIWEPLHASAEILFPINALNAVAGVALTVKNFEDVVNNKSPDIPPKLRRWDLQVDFGHVLLEFVREVGALIPPIGPIGLGLHIGLQSASIAMNRVVNFWDFKRRASQGYDPGHGQYRWLARTQTPKSGKG